MLFKTIACALCLAWCAPAVAQTKTIAQSVKELGSIFKKKKKDSAAATNTQAGAPTMAGTPAAGVKYINADQLYPFNAGAALVRKGSSAGLIDTAGNFIVPYNTYNLTGIFVAGPDGYTVRYNGMYAYNNINQNWGGFINSRGTVILKTGLNTGVTNLTDNKRMLVTSNSSHNTVSYTYTAPDGKTYTLSQLLENINEGIGITRGKPGATGGISYRRLTGETVAGGFDDAAPFSNGMACVGKKDAYGELKYGFINTQGRLVIPFSFSVQPGNFMGGFARVQPKDKSAFEYAFINKRGEIVWKQTQQDVYKNGVFDHFTNYGLAFSEKAVMDTSFALIAKADFFRSFGLPADSWLVDAGSYTEGESNPKLVYSTRAARSPYTQMPVYGFINLATKTVVAPVFDFLNVNGLYFDPVSHLAYAKVCTGRNNNNVPVFREGYINEAGQFVLLKGAAAQW